VSAQERALLQVVLAVREAVAAAAPLGCPAGTVYAALMAQGCTIQQYEQIEALMLRTGAMTKKGDLLFAPQAVPNAAP
jgi:hypothetical protein